jgi:radical SAM protein with 4Fe4S-binding SPASM domain
MDPLVFARRQRARTTHRRPALFEPQREDWLDLNFGYLKYASVGANFLLKRTTLPPGRLISLTIETTNICNFKCVYCPQSDPDNHFINGKGVMSLETFQRVLDNILEDFKPKFISLHRDGEPLVNKNLEDYIAYARSRGLRTGVSSNCSLLTQERAQNIIDSGLAFIKTDFCADAQTYERLRAGGRWQKTFDGMVNLLAAARRRGDYFQMTITDISTYGVSPDETEGKMARLRELFAEYPDYVGVMPVHFHNALDESAERMGEPTGDTYTLCHHPWVHITVDFNANVVPCCRDLRSEYICGNLLETPMRDIWNNERFLKLRRALVAKKPEEIDICAKCDLPYKGSYSGKSFFTRARNLLLARIWRR